MCIIPLNLQQIIILRGAQKLGCMSLPNIQYHTLSYALEID